MKSSLVAIGIGTLAVHAALAENNRDPFNQPLHRESTMCIALFSPATCTGSYAGEQYEAKGTNECFAVQNLVEKINNAYAWFVEVKIQDVQQLVCTDSVPDKPE
jgi:hypothetical protein